MGGVEYVVGGGVRKSVIRAVMGVGVGMRVVESVMGVEECVWVWLRQ